MLHAVILTAATDTARPPSAGSVAGDRQNGEVQLIIAGTERHRFAIVDAVRTGEPVAVVTADELPAAVRELEAASHPRWVWSETQLVYPALLEAGVRIERCHDLRLCAAILDRSTLTEQFRSSGRSPHPAWLAPGPAEAGAAIPAPAVQSPHTLFDLDEFADPGPAGAADDDGETPESATDASDGSGISVEAVAREFERQQAMVADSADPRALRLLLAAESAGALVGAEMHAAGLPWDRAVHERVLEEALGARPKPGFKPARVEQLAARVRAALDGPSVNLDSQVDLLRALRRAGIQVDSTSRWELRRARAPGDRTAHRLQEAHAAPERQRLGLARRVGA